MGSWVCIPSGYRVLKFVCGLPLRCTSVRLALCSGITQTSSASARDLSVLIAENQQLWVKGLTYAKSLQNLALKKFCWQILFYCRASSTTDYHSERWTDCARDSVLRQTLRHVEALDLWMECACRTKLASQISYSTPPNSFHRLMQAFWCTFQRTQPWPHY